MVYRKKYIPRKPLSVPKRKMVMIRRTRPSKIVNKVHRYKRWARRDAFIPIVSAGAAEQHLAYSFQLNQVVNVTDFTNLYDQYRINKVTMYLERYQSDTTVTAGPYSAACRVVHDYNDANLLTNEDEYLEYANCKSFQVVSNKPVHKIVLYPKIVNFIEGPGGSINNQETPSNKIWINTSNQGTPHFGLKMFIPGSVAGTGIGLFQVRVQFDISFKNAK